MRRRTRRTDTEGPRRQWGSDRRDAPDPVAPPASDVGIALSKLAVVLTVVGWLGFIVLSASRTTALGGGELPIDAGLVGYVVVTTLLGCSALAYLIARLGHLARTRTHRRASVRELRDFAGRAPTLTVLVPSYQEDDRVNRLTLLSAALQEYPDLELVLLIDDPPSPRYARPAAMLADARRLPGELERQLAEPLGRALRALDAFDERTDGRSAQAADEALRVAEAHDDAAAWLERSGAEYVVVDHTDRFLVEHVLLALARDLRATAAALREATDAGATLPRAALRGHLQRLPHIFGARISSFSRKRYVSLSHEPNKAMNLNSYLGLMGGAFRERTGPDGVALVPAPEAEADLVVRDPDFVLTLDSDSLLLPGYCLRITRLLEQAQHARIAVAQAPYSAFPGASTRIERIAGATTDLQYLVHQGMTAYGATFWVGANAVLRKRALDDLCEVDHEGDWEIRRYVSDRTVIEDTESSIDLGTHGWGLLNYPERLSYSATPADFGALSIQRGRWANGGLLILPRLWQQVRARRRRGERPRFGEVFLRVNYMASIAWSTAGLLYLLVFRFDDRLLSPFIVLISVPYFVALAADLRSCGYRARDVLGIYGFNLVLLAVNLMGVISSLVQGLTSTKAAFRRTPKVRGRTAPSLLFVLAPYVFVAFSVVTFLGDFGRERWLNAGFAAINGILASFAIVAYIGVRNSVVDVGVNVLSWLHRPSDTARPAPIRARRRVTTVRTPAAPATPHWAAVLGELAGDDPVVPRVPPPVRPGPPDVVVGTTPVVVPPAAATAATAGLAVAATALSSIAEHRPESLDR
ncbi:glycosyltransferase family 2 protein [Patulibacter sp.]|uniref:glycosyltransferase family 2 protein n=1 Tax=Patulibacter sp. TaxID=1912859 RepID=UPI00272913C7|nr:glycosyltransferase family 2 protein [Patulibacter sp.]MDO9410162.1 glycosyltransferase family 2 protein [Patulibacter sp.]